MRMFFAMFIFVFGLINAYLFIRGWQALPSCPVLRPVYTVLFWLTALSFLGSRVFENALPVSIADAMTWVGSFWLAALVYLFLAMLVLDAIRAVNHFLPFFPGFVVENYARAKYITLCIVLVSVALTLVGGFINTRVPRIRNMEILISKQAGNLKSLNVVMAADIHIGTIVGRSWLGSIVDKINALSPDLVLLPGDIIDVKTDTLIRENIGEELQRIQARHGVYAVPGNHEYIGCGGDLAVRYLTENNITVLRDESIKVEDSFFIVGRDDYSANRYTGEDRKELKTLMEGVDGAFPIILMDHQPHNLSEAAENGVDLQLSGHTHYGQLWPLNYVVEAVYELAWGYKQMDGTHYYVTNGAATWGPPVRVGNRPEIVLIRLSFQ